MTTATWQLKTPLDALIFDCDGTLSRIEGIDELAKKNRVGSAVEALTAEAMGRTGLSPTLYKRRLDLVKPTHEQVIALGMEYFTHRIPEVELVIAGLKQLNKAIYIISAGLHPAVNIFGKLLDVPEANIFAVDIEFDDQGHFLDFNRHSPLTSRDGKRVILTELQDRHEKMAYIGDGLNDYIAHDLVTRFIGFGGAYYRENIADLCQFYIKSLTLTPILPLCLTKREVKKLSAEGQELYQQGMKEIENGGVIIR